MECPQCQSLIPAASARCPRCALRLLGQEALDEAGAFLPIIVAVPLTESQKFQLRLGLGLPLAIGGGMLWLFFALANRFGQNVANTKAMLALVFGAIGAVVLYVAARNLRDLLRGSANARTDMLLETRRVSDTNGPRYYARFAAMGEMTLNSEMFRTLREGQPYRITYSPASMRIWEVEPAGQPAAGAGPQPQAAEERAV